MTSEEVEQYLMESGQRDWEHLPEPVRRHLENCPESRALWELIRAGTAPLAVPPQLCSKISSRILPSLERVKPLPSTPLLALGFLFIFGLLSAVFVALFGLQGAATMGRVAFAVVLGVVGAACVLLAVTLGRAMVPGERKLLAPALLFSMVLSALFVAVAVLFPWQMGASFLAGSWHCFRAGFFSAIPAALLMALLLRRGAVLSHGAVGAGAGLLAGLVGVVSLHFSCAVNKAPHMALAHLGVPAAGVVLGYLIGRCLPLVQGRSRQGGSSR